MDGSSKTPRPHSAHISGVPERVEPLSGRFLEALEGMAVGVQRVLGNADVPAGRSIVEPDLAIGWKIEAYSQICQGVGGRFRP